MPDLSAELEELVVDTDRGGPAAEAALLGQLQAQQRHDVSAVRVHRLRQRSRIHARCGRLDVVSNVPIAERLPFGALCSDARARTDQETQLVSA